MRKLNFKPITLECREEMEPYLKGWNSMSCQYSFPNLWCLREKYGTEFCVEENVLYLRQIKRKNGNGMAYFPPVAGRTGGDVAGDASEKAVHRQLERIWESAAEEGVSPWLFGLTEERLSELREVLPAGYHLVEDRDWAEYIYTAEALSALPGSALSGKRRDISAFWRKYGEETTVECISRENIGDAAAFQNRWQQENAAGNADAAQLAAEHTAILSGLERYEELGFSGILMRIGGEAAAYSYGTYLGKHTFDVIAQKADYRYKNITPALFTETVKRCCRDTYYVNYEEDIGLTGLRRAKMSYRPQFLLKKYCAVRTGKEEKHDYV